ncbi:hypothetical protein AHAS_Ahas05G0035300 [Arachis hypogaea]
MLVKERYFNSYQMPMWSGDIADVMFEVYSEPHNVVINLKNYTCICRSWQLSGIGIYFLASFLFF